MARSPQSDLQRHHRDDLDIRDFLGRSIEVGDIVVYPQVHGGGPHMVMAEVLETFLGKDRDNSVKPKLRVQRLHHSFHYVGGPSVAVITNTDRCVRVRRPEALGEDDA